MKRLLIYVYLYMLFMFLTVNFAVSPVLSWAIKDYFQQSTSPYWRDMARGPYHVIEERLADLPVDRWGEAVAAWQHFFAFPIDIRPLEAGQRSEAEALALRQGEIVVQGAGESFDHRIGESGLVLHMGPMPKIESKIPGFEARLQRLQVLFYSVIVVLFFAFALIWTLPFARNLKRIITAATTFGEGELDVRARVSKRSSLALLAETFNSMAGRIQELITSHKELTHMASHELRTPLARIRFNMELMSSAANPIEREKQYDEIRRNVDELDMLVSELLTYARLDRQSYRPPTEVLELGPWLMGLTATYHTENPHVDIDCRINSLDPDVPVQANPRLLARAVCNLLHNAARYYRQRIHVTLETTDEHRLIHVDDDGPGVAESDRKKIFEPFVRLNHTEEAETHGYGLGLAIVQRIVQWHGGQATIEDASIGGARFTLWLPIPPHLPATEMPPRSPTGKDSRQR